jgi:lipopolysaccharide transport system ATP-binding protein
MADAVIRADGLGKSYQLRHQRDAGYVALRDVLTEKARALGRRLAGRAEVLDEGGTEEFWALRNLSFEVHRGEVLGVIGRNGAGKSTLLKILSRITEPTAGKVRLRGRVSSLLEVGTGFHPELSGRENVYLNGAILGMSRAEIRRKFDDIVAFADVEKFLDTPVKRYSSGMYVRLAFAVAAHLEPEILIVDEVLAVGDVEFQRKCLGKMKSVATMDGRTILFVSHNMSAIQTLCSRAIWLRNGEIAGIGDAREQIAAYLHSAADQHGGRRRKLSRMLALESLAFTPGRIESGGAAEFSIVISSEQSAQMKELVVMIYTGLGARAAILDLRSATQDYSLEPGRPLRVQGRIRSLPLVEGEYSIGLFVNCADLREDIFDVGTLTVTHAHTAGAITPYPPVDRGVLELAYEFDRS